MTYSRAIKTALPSFNKLIANRKTIGRFPRYIHISNGNEPLPSKRSPQNDQIKSEDLASSRFFALHRPLLSVNGNDAFLNTEAIFPKIPPRTPTPETIFDNDYESELPQELETGPSTIPEYVRMGPFAGTVIPPPNLFLMELPQDTDVLKNFFEDIKRKYTECTPEVNQLDRACGTKENNLELDEPGYSSIRKKSPLGK